MGVSSNSARLQTDVCWQNCTVTFSGQEVPGEGEHKVMDFIRARKMGAGYSQVSPEVGFSCSDPGRMFWSVKFTPFSFSSKHRGRCWGLSHVKFRFFPSIYLQTTRWRRAFAYHKRDAYPGVGNSFWSWFDFLQSSRVSATADGILFLSRYNGIK